MLVERLIYFAAEGLFLPLGMMFIVLFAVAITLCFCAFAYARIKGWDYNHMSPADIIDRMLVESNKKHRHLRLVVNK